MEYWNQKFFFVKLHFWQFLNFSPSSKIDFCPFLKLQKMEFGEKNFFVKLIYLISRVFLAWDNHNYIWKIGLVFIFFIFSWKKKFFWKNIYNSRTYFCIFLGLKTMDEAGKLHFYDIPGGHLQLSLEWFKTEIIQKFFMWK